MEDNNDKSKTMEFTPHESKKEIERNQDDIYSMQRKTPQYSFDYEEEENEQGDNKMMYAAIALAVILAVVIIAGIFVIKGTKGKKEENPPAEDTVIKEEEKDNTQQEEKEEEIVEKSVSYSTVFYGDSVIQKENYYTILADIYDKNMKKVDNRKLLINSDTDIYENGKRITPEALIYTVEALAGEGIIFDCTIRESDNFAESISFEGTFKEQLPEKEIDKTPEKEEKNEDVPAENIPTDQLPQEDNN